MKTALVFPPQWYPSQPYLALPTLKGFLENKGHQVDQIDINIEIYDIFLSREYLEKCVGKIQERISQPVYTNEENQIRGIWSQILSDGDYLETVYTDIEEAKEVMRSEEKFFQFPVYKRAYTTLKVAMKLISYAHFPSRIDLESFFMQGNPEENLAGIMQATIDPITNPYLSVYKESFLSQMNWDQYGLLGISIIHIGQVIPGLTFSRLMKKIYPNLHIVIGGSIFTRHADQLKNKQEMFETLFDSLILFEGEAPLEKLVCQLKEGKSLNEVPNLVHLQNGEVVQNFKGESLQYEQLARPSFEQLPLEKYLMPYPVLPYMASRGCYWGKCTFCTHSHIYDSYYRKENEDKVAEDLEYYSKKHNTRFFTFSDEAISPNAFSRMSKAVLERKLDMKALGMIKFESDNAESPGLFEEMFQAGFIMLFFGLESANDRILSLIEKGTDQDNERTVLKNSSEGGIWNHLYLFFGFPTEERYEAEDTINFTVEHGESGTGIIHSVGQSIFTLEKDSAIYHNPGKFAIDRLITDPERDLAIIFDYEISKGMPHDEVREVYESFDATIQDKFPSRKIWNYLSREHFLLYLDKFGRDEILNMAADEDLVGALDG